VLGLAHEQTSRYCAEGDGVLRQGHDDNLAEIEIGDYESGRAEF
jgi:hypothetical protein